MNYHNILSIIGKVLLILAGVQILPLAVAIYYGESIVPFAVSMFAALVIGYMLHRFSKPDNDEWMIRESYAVVALSWLFCAFFCAIPFLFAGLSPLNALFESMSGVTTTGSTILSDIESYSRSILFWRCFIQWLGGLGIIALFIAVIPKVNLRGRQLYKTEFSGPTEDKISPKISNTAKILWVLYIGITLVLVVILLALNMSFYDAVVHSFSTMASGGFSPYNDSIKHFGDFKIEIVLTVFMLIAGTNFALIHKSLTKNIRYLFRDEEFKAYILFFAVIVGLLSILLIRDMDYGVWESLRYSAFQISSLMSTTGFVSTDYNVWSDAAKMVLLLAMFTGSCSGSTSGGPTFVRWLIIIRHSRRDIFKFLHPNAVRPIKYNGKSLPEDLVHSVLSFMFLYLMVFAISAVLLCILGLDFVTAVTSSITSLGNVGPAFGAMIGPFDNFGILPPLSRIILIANMWIGRLELYTVLLLFTSEFWKK
ncbi:Trk system potassium uptake protein TrkH [Methanosarcinaceae archaeon Ag5]|uniref:Trk system potassium uptake protein TrkH n=1 Tax=Methanolapillus africanus TaxID=3028297 RepID=A0AAE4SFP7_9EURY|nr:Trk system potassium uptake protein TrkH [Methanosarcinaceae archaeon Ag5]